MTLVGMAVTDSVSLLNLSPCDKSHLPAVLIYLGSCGASARDVPRHKKVMSASGDFFR